MELRLELGSGSGGVVSEEWGEGVGRWSGEWGGREGNMSGIRRKWRVQETLIHSSILFLEI